MDIEVKRRLGPHVQRRGDGFTEAESMGLLQLVQSRWREGWDVIAQLHNAQFAKHNRSADSLKKKFSRLYRSNIPPRGAKNHQAIAFAHIVHKEMIEGVPPAPGSALLSVGDETPIESNEASFQPPQGDDHTQDGATESEHSWVDTTAEVPPAAATSITASSTTTVPVPAPGATTPPAGPPAVVVPRPRVRVPRQMIEWQNPAAVFPPEATPLPTDDLLTSVLKVILRSQYQRDLDREEERQHREEERQRRRDEAEQRRQEEDRRRDEEREERRRRNEERAENRRRHEQFMQMMMLLVGKNGTPEQRDTEC